MNLKINDNLYKIIFPLHEEWHGYETESLWAKKISDNKYQIENSPFYASGISFNDIVLVRKNESGELFFDSVYSAGGHSTYRIILNKESGKHNFQNYWHPLAIMGCTFESSVYPEILAVDVPPESDIYKIYALLEIGEKNGVWTFDEGHCGHPLN